MRTDKKTSVVTGGAGFLGSHLSEKLLGQGHNVICVDNLLTGSKDNIASFLERPDFEFIEHDVTKYIDLGNSQVDFVFHFASPASPIDYLRLPIQTLKVGSLGTHNALGLAKAKNACFLLASTSETYGDPQIHPQDESYWGHVNPVGPRGVYDEAKRFSEAMTMAYHRYHGVATRIVRIFNTYGPGMRVKDGRMLPAFISQSLTGKPLTVFGDGSQTRSICYVSDLIEGIYRLSQSEEVYPVNIGNPQEMTVLQVAEKILEMTGSNSPIEFHPLPEDDPKVRQPDITKAKRVLGWEPKIHHDEGLEKTIAYFKSAIFGSKESTC